MASQSFIINGENAICALTPTVQNLIEALKNEIKSNANADNSRVYKENSDCWGSVAANAAVLLRNLRTLIFAIDEGRKVPEKTTVDHATLRNPAYDGPMGIFDDYEGCESGIDTTPSPEKEEDPERWDGQS